MLLENNKIVRKNKIAGLVIEKNIEVKFIK
jgi:hypothetical protein